MKALRWQPRAWSPELSPGAPAEDGGALGETSRCSSLASICPFSCSTRPPSPAHTVACCWNPVCSSPAQLPALAALPLLHFLTPYRFKLDGWQRVIGRVMGWHSGLTLTFLPLRLPTRCPALPPTLPEPVSVSPSLPSPPSPPAHPRRPSLAAPWPLRPAWPRPSPPPPPQQPMRRAASSAPTSTTTPSPWAHRTRAARRCP